MNSADLLCDGCGQPASAEHIKRRLQRLEWTTRYRPVHIGTLLLGAVAPQSDRDFLYSPAGDWGGEAQFVLRAAAITAEGKSPDATLAEFQRGGFLLTHVLECPVEEGHGQGIPQLLEQRLPAVLARIRRSLKPKRLVPISRWLSPLVPILNSGALPCAILLDQNGPFALDDGTQSEAAERLRKATAVQGMHAAGE